jgi:hypothetical protein
MKLDDKTRACMREYIAELQKKYTDLESEPFSAKARIAIRQEIEQAKVMLESDRMESTWSSLSAVFNLPSSEKPDWENEYGQHSDFEEEPSGFKSRMAAQDSSFD